MGSESKQMILGLESRLRMLEEQMQGIPVRFSTSTAGGSSFVEATADAFISAEGTGDVTLAVGGTKTVANLLSFPIWEGSTVWLDFGKRHIAQTDAATLLWATYNGGSVTDPANYTAAALMNRDHYDATGSSVTISDPGGLLIAAGGGESVVFATGGPPDTLRVISTSPVPGPTGPTGPAGNDGADGDDGNDGTIANVISAFVNVLGGIDSGTPTYGFNGGVALIGTGVATGTGQNTTGKPLSDNQKVVLAQEEGGSWHTVEAGVNVITANVNKAGGVADTDATFLFDGGTDQLGIGPNSGTATNIPRRTYSDDEKIALIQVNDNTWIPISKEGGDTAVVVVSGTIAAATVSGTSITPGTGSASKLEWSGSAWGSPVAITVHNLSQTSINGPAGFLANKVGGEWVLANFDLYGLPGAGTTAHQIAWHKNGNKNFELESLGGYSSGSKQVIWHDAGGDDLEFKSLVTQQVLTDYDHANKEFDEIDVFVIDTSGAGTISIATSECTAP